MTSRYGRSKRRAAAQRIAELEALVVSHEQEAQKQSRRIAGLEALERNSFGAAYKLFVKNQGEFVRLPERIAEEVSGILARKFSSQVQEAFRSVSHKLEVEHYAGPEYFSGASVFSARVSLRADISHVMDLRLVDRGLLCHTKALP